jgi:hypothetical protein
VDGDFGDGTWIVPDEVAAGLYRNTDSSDFCDWERLAGFSGEFEDLITNGFSDEIFIVEVKPSDAGFSSNRCGGWTSDLSPRTSSPTADFGGGHHQVGPEIAPGTWRNSDSSETCYWERLAGFSGEFEDLITNGLSDEIFIVEVKPSDAGFSSNRCGGWTSDLSPRTSSPTADFGGGHHQVGPEIAPGTWRNSDSSETCYWERLSGFSGEFDDLIVNGLSDIIQPVTIADTDGGFSSNRCGTWARVGS